MTRIIQGVFDFQRRVFGGKRELFEQLGSGQRPLALFITCSDSRVNPNLLTQTEPGELFVLRNAGNLVPPDGSPPSGEAATIEYAVHHLHVRDLILCGHSQCGAMQGLITPGAADGMPAVVNWLAYAQESVARAQAINPRAGRGQLLQSVIEQNVLLQIEHVKSYPLVREAVTAGKLRLHAWCYGFESGDVTAFDAQTNRFVPLAPPDMKKMLVPLEPIEQAPADRNM